MILLSIASTVSMTYVALALYSFGEFINIFVEYILSVAGATFIPVPFVFKRELKLS